MFRLIHRAAAGLALALVLVAPAHAEAGGNGNGNGAAQANSNSAVSQSAASGCTNAHNANFSGNGANQHGPYDSTCNGSPSLNGNNASSAALPVGQPCAGCVGNADYKQPPGQFPGGTDRNAGYECDRNRGIGRTNPAHSGCVVSVAIGKGGGVLPTTSQQISAAQLPGAGAGLPLPLMLAATVSLAAYWVSRRQLLA